MPDKNSIATDNISRFDIVSMAYSKLLQLNAKKTQTKKYIPYPTVFLRFAQAPLCFDKPTSRIVLKKLRRQRLVNMLKNGVEVL